MLKGHVIMWAWAAVLYEVFRGCVDIITWMIQYFFGLYLLTFIDMIFPPCFAVWKSFQNFSNHFGYILHKRFEWRILFIFSDWSNTLKCWFILTRLNGSLTQTVSNILQTVFRIVNETHN
jgi:hypothetical protein